jgi:hypothetical protein
MSQTSREDHGVTIPGGYSKSRAIRHVLSQLDELYRANAQRPAVDVPSTSEPLNTDSDVPTDPGIGQSTDASEVDGEREGGSDNPRESLAPAERSGGETNAEHPGEQVESSEPPSGTDEQQTPSERALTESPTRYGQYADVEFHFAPGLHSRGDQFS